MNNSAILCLRCSCFNMKSCTLSILILLGLFYKASSGENSTLAYYIELNIEEAAYDNFIELLQGLTLNMNDIALVQNISITTECSTLASGKVNCSCNSGYSWSDEVCKNYTHCCLQSDICDFAAPNPRAMCLSEKRVTVNGSFTLQMNVRSLFPNINDIQNTESQDYKQFVSKYTNALESVFSTLVWFDSLTITAIRLGSVIGSFVMMLTAPVNVNKLENATISLQNSINATFSLAVRGMTSIKNPQQPVPYDNITSITCCKLKQLKIPTWSFQKDGKYPQIITNGTEATVTSNSENSTVSISKTTEVWKGTYTCDYKSDSSVSIIYRANLDLDIALLPQILIFSDPQFPNCIRQTNPLTITVHCMVQNGNENYTVMWTSQNTMHAYPDLQINENMDYYAQYSISCNMNLEIVTVTCHFKNRINQTRNATLNIHVIQGNSPFCKGDGVWGDAKANYTAIRLCNPPAVGLHKRNCTNVGKWDSEISECVTQNLTNLLNDATNLQRGQGIVEGNADGIYNRLRQSTEDLSVKTYANINASVDVLYIMNNASQMQNSKWNETVFPFQDFVKSSSNLLNGSLNYSWSPVGSNDSYSLASKYLNAVEGIIKQTNLNAALLTDMSALQQDNVQIIMYNTSNNMQNRFSHNFNVSVTEVSSNVSVLTAINNLASKLPNMLYNKETYVSDTILSVVGENNTRISMLLNINRLRNHRMYCVFWDSVHHRWSDEGCSWGGLKNPDQCICEHLTSFTIMMAKEPIKLQYMEELTYAGLSFSILSLILGLVIEFLVWNTVVKTNIAHFRHTVLVNIMVCLSIADSSFLAAPVPSSSPSNWCLSLTVLKHFCYLAVFFWMLCLSLGLLHQVIFVFVPLRKNVYLGLCFLLGYVCPLIIVIVTIITYGNAMAGQYYSTETCWLIYVSALKGSIHAFLFPVFVIVFLNMFTMVVVISRILKPTLSEGSTHDEKEIARSIIKTVVLLTPTLGITWILGLFVLVLDLTLEPYAQIVNYAFTFFNSFQGFFILLTGCFGEKRVRGALHKRFRLQQSQNYKTESSSRFVLAEKKK
ncbi:adhesion G-protein coupled receptor F3 [Hoplias malabaricus]|uniref:adhesion G-protein coupled receptor F3 n=1 Tax=Hoplias malabaricus TaxID=27720 RepID=UPI003462C803